MVNLTAEQKEALKNIIAFAKDYLSEKDEPLLPELEEIFK